MADFDDDMDLEEHFAHRDWGSPQPVRKPDEPLKPLAVDLGEIATTMSLGERYDSEYFLDLRTGDLVTIMFESLQRAGSGRTDVEGLPDWRRRDLASAIELINDTTGRYVVIPERESYDAYEVMERFIGTVASEPLRNRLYRAIEGKGAFRRFKNELSRVPEERERWFAFETAAEEQEAREWMESMGYEPIPRPKGDQS